MLTPEQEAIAQTFLVPFETPEHLRVWCHTFLDIDFPLGSIDPGSNSSPSEWLFEAYKAIQNNEGDVKPTFVVYSSRDSYKTLSCAALEIIGMVHFNLTIAHMAAIESQSKKTVEYVTTFLKKLKPYLEYHGRSIDSQNTRNLSVVNKDGDVAYLTIIIATLTGSNSAHTNFMCVDGDSRISIQNPNPTSKRKLLKVTAENLFKKLHKGQILKALSYNHLSDINCFEFKDITNWTENEKQLYTIKTRSGSISATEEHRFFVIGKGYRELKDIQPGDLLTAIGKKTPTSLGHDYSIDPDPVVSIEKGETKKVYDFTVEDNHNYITNGFLSHNCVDEVDVVRFPQAYEEAKMIPGMLKGRFPITVMTSTRKFAFGLMQKEIEIANENGHPVLHWNILDITEKCQPERHKPELPKAIRYVAKRLPFRNMSPEEYDAILPEKKSDYEAVEGYAGCASCALFQVCRTRLAHRPDKDVGGLYKPISFTINQFKKVTPDMAEAQLLCLKPSSTGLVYPRFDDSEGENVLTLNQAWKSFYGTEPDFEVTLGDLIDTFKKKGIRFYVGGDWGFRHAYALIAAAILPSGEFWIFETLAIPGLEFEEMIKYAEYFRDKYRPAKWFMDTAQPMFIKGFRKRGMPCKDFKKDVLGGIEAIRGQIVDASNRRRLKILKTTENQFLVDGFNKHHFITDAAGNVTQTPDDEEYADACFAPGTMITTSAGLKNIEEISCSDMVLTHTGQFKRVLGVMSRKYSGSMIQLEVSGKPDTLVTPNHMYFVSDCLRSNAVEYNKKLTGQRRITNNWEWKTPSNFHEINGIKTKTSPRTATLYPASSFSTDRYIIDMAKFLPHYKKNGDMLESNPQSGFRIGFESTTIKRYLEVTEEIAFLVGYFVAEGSLGGNRTQICFAGHQKETSVEDILNKAMEQVGASPVITKNNSETKGRVIYANSRALTSILKPLGKEKHKHFPEWSNLLPKECVIAMLAGYAYGDGCFKNSSQNNSAFSVGSISSSISSKVYHFMVMLGYRPNMRKARRMGRWSGLGEGGAIQSDMFIVTAGSSETINMIEDFYKNNLIKKAFQTKDVDIIPAQAGSHRSQFAGIGLASNVQSVKQVHYDGMVYNLEVEDDNSYVANLSAVHNCDAIRYLGQNLFEPKKKLSAGASNPILLADKEKKRLEMYKNSPEKLYSDALMSKINSLTTEVVEEAKGINDTGTVIWDFSHPINDKS